MLVVEFDAEHRSREHGGDAAFDFNVFFFHAGQLKKFENEKAEFSSPELRPEILLWLSSDCYGHHGLRRRRIHDDRRHRRQPDDLHADEPR